MSRMFASDWRTAGWTFNRWMEKNVFNVTHGPFTVWPLRGTKWRLNGAINSLPVLMLHQGPCYIGVPRGVLWAFVYLVRSERPVWTQGPMTDTSVTYRVMTSQFNVYVPAVASLSLRKIAFKGSINNKWPSVCHLVVIYISLKWTKWNEPWVWLILICPRHDKEVMHCGWICIRTRICLVNSWSA